MISLKSFFRRKMARLLIVLFAVFLLASNLTVFLLAGLQYKQENERQEAGFLAMMTHLYTQEGEDAAAAFAEHYFHTQNIRVALYDAGGTLLYETDPAPASSERLPLEDDGGTLVGSVLYDEQSSYFGSDLTIGLILTNVASVLAFLIFFPLLNRNLEGWYGMMKGDLDRIGTDDGEYRFNDLAAVGGRLKEARDSETRIRDYQKEYVRMLAHDVKTPLTVIRANLEGIRLGRIEPEDAVLKDMMDEVDEIERMIPRFLTDGTESMKKNQDVSLLIRAVLRRMTEVFRAKRITVTEKLEPVFLNVSSLDISRVAEHLLFNAFYYTPEGGAVGVELDKNKKSLIVRDTGIGMDEETLKRIQEGPYRSPKAREMQKTGSGIGLQIVFEILRRVGMTIRFESVPGKGTTVTIQWE